MRVYQRGEGEPEFAVVGSVHGDEPAGKKAIEKIIEADIEFKKPVKFIIANEKALEQDKRFLDSDLNRSFPGNPESDSHEERLAAELLEEVKDIKVLDLHTTRSFERPFATTKSLRGSVVEMAGAAGVEKAVYFPEDSGILIEQTEGIVVETGLQGSKQAFENAVKVVENFLSYFGAIDADYVVSDPEFYRYYETVEGDWEFLAENFQKVHSGQVYAKNNDKVLEASESFYPVLMSTNGYEGQLGFKAEKLD